jgi:hypothetical protein
MAQGGLGGSGQRVIPCWISDLYKADWRAAVQTQPQPYFSIMGVVVAVAAPGDFTSETGQRRPVGYRVDDGTGVIRVAHFLGSRRVAAQNAANIPDRLVKALAGVSKGDEGADDGVRSLAQATRRLVEDSRGEFPVGSTVAIVGRLQSGFRGGPRELLAQTVRRVKNPCLEVDRTLWLEETLRPRESYPHHMFNKQPEDQS